ncbi:leucyl/phenylalanyl-tRNA--protein transferase [Winogradskyella sp.]|uniref:leucyl/phenylalanyl-tRNA--protein transferase n=1 Tax=Winogradskyella sp. TaxID=1883156 RepID=UPI0026084C0E|nr:leucyl/phenylalanyl-tRNA--protein transferase [Winogradskyella sp.]
MYFLTQKIEFPDVSEATSEGLLAVGGDLSTERLIHAYTNGIFPWFEDEEPLLWWSPDPRFVLFPKELKVSKSMSQLFKKNLFKVTFNKDFESVIEQCAMTKREGQEGTWITEDMKKAYIKLHGLGYAKSAEVWQDGELVGGLYGVDLGNKVFCGESMFAKVSNASKVGFVHFVQNSNYSLIDCQIYTKHLESLGAKHISRQEFLKYL